MQKNKLTIGYIGNGKSVNRYHIPYILARTDKYYIKKIFQRKPGNCNWPKIDKVIYTSDLEELLKDDGIDLIVVCTPNGTHYSFAKKVLEAGKHCLVEKPFAMTALEAKQLFDLADLKQLHIVPYQNRRFDSDYLTVKKVIGSGRLGELLEEEINFDYYRPEVPESSSRYSVENSFVYSNASHSLDQAISLWGKPDFVHYDVRQLMGEGHMNDYFDIDLYYDKLKISVKSSYFRLKKRPAFALYGKKGVFIKEKKDRQEEDLKRFYFPYKHEDFGIDRPEDYGKLQFIDSKGNYIEEIIPSAYGDYGRVYDEIYDMITSRKTPFITQEQIILQMEILENAVKHLK